jgi:hypothetical protein
MEKSLLDEPPDGCTVRRQAGFGGRATSIRFQPVGCVTLALVPELSHKPCFDGGRSPFCRHGHALSP